MAIQPTTKVCVISGGTSPSIEEMFRRQMYYRLTTVPTEADLIVISGGADISPSWYGEEELDVTSSRIEQDMYEFAAITFALNNGIPLAGICRGAQFINVLAGGRLRQDVTKHRGVNHKVQDEAGKFYTVNSLHHQMMVPSTRQKNKILLCANEGAVDTISKKQVSVEVEAVFYPDMKALCMQSHPEFEGCGDAKTLFFNYLESYLIG